MNKFLLQVGILLFLCGTAFAQTRQITGQVTEKGTKDPLPAVTVLVKGTTAGTQTDMDGNFKLNVSSNATVTLVFRSVGYKALEIVVPTSQNKVNAAIETDARQLSEVVAIGYGTVKRGDLANSVSSIGSKDLRDNPSNSLAEAMNGKLAGVQITVSQGAPGAEADINIRGRNSISQSSSPLFVVDGVQVDNALNVLSPQDIATIDVLKDAASTAIYGSRGSNGVVIITTKVGKNTNGKFNVIYNALF